MIEVSDTIVVGCVASMTGAICYMAKLIYNEKKNQVTGMKRTITQHGKDAAVMRASAKLMQQEVDKLSQGCGAPTCMWANKTNSPNHKNRKQNK